ncbi:MAG: carbohydrate-binding protein [Spirochaetales bacterium]|nr:carbohydrate-binding protein [Spirochaetales bacterium]
MIIAGNPSVSIIIVICTGLLLCFSCSPIQLLNDLEGLSTPLPNFTSDPGATAEPTLEITPEPTPELTEEPTPGSTPESTEEPTPDSTPELTEEPTPEPTAESTPGSTPESTPESTDEPTPTPVPTTTPSPTPTQIPKDAFSIIQGEYYDDCSTGIIVSSYCVVHIGDIDDGSWALYGSMNFATGAAGFEVYTTSSNGGGTIEIRLDSLTGTLAGSCAIPDTGGWCSYELVACSISGVSGIHDLYLVFTGDGTGLFNVDWFKFLDTAPTATPTPAPTPDPRIYDDGLVNNWDDWSWDCTRNFNCMYPVYDGNYSLSALYNLGYAALYFHNAAGDIQLSYYTSLTFYIHGGMTGGQSLRVSFRNNFDVQVGDVLLVDDYLAGGSVSPNTWEEVQIPLADFGISGGIIRKIIFQSDESTALPVFYLDKIEFN